MIKKVLLASALAVATAGTAAQAATVVFSDDFSGYGTTTVLNAPDSLFLGNWSTTDGTIDYLAAGDSYGNLCVGGGNCIDLDGSTGDAGVFTSLSFGPGKYKLDVSMFGDQRGGTNSVVISLGDWSVTVGPFNSSDDASGSWTFTTTTAGGLSFANSGGDNVGAILTGVTLAAVPLPAGGLLLLGALGGVAALRRRKSV